MEYKAKLIQFNKTQNYNNELRFMANLIDPQEGEVIVDYGCGTGYMIKRIKELKGVQCLGYDVTDYSEYCKESIIHAIPSKIDKVYFMHSIAHIPNLVDVLRTIYNSMTEDGRIYIMTPNKDWLDLIDNPNYKPDTTVFNHYNNETMFQVMNAGGFLPVLDGQFGNFKQGKCERYFGIFHRKYD